MGHFLGAMYSRKLDVLQDFGRWLWLLKHRMCSRSCVTLEGFYTTRRVPHKVCNAITYFQATLTHLLRGPKSEIRVDDIS